MPFDELVRKIASLGLPAVMFAVACSIAAGMGLAGGAVITTALALLGGPFGMVVGIGVLGISTLIGDAVAKFGIKKLLIGVYKVHLENGRSCSELSREIRSLWISEDLKLEIIREIGC
ncbi:hypothetical protein FJR11_22480 [Anabaena sp. UHCC 0187]|uniref:hypothetical protein n=1 Tax=Anabaena sp. UHCC 0187 TaxID=2590018 RepID=UPI0014470E2D|nr:hypothetical protein [Anabaena sp. UHCC 0187]MTJ15278.1 hypothetical protein [Anabaena sp. UHCC 0187]